MIFKHETWKNTIKKQWKVFLLFSFVSFVFYVSFSIWFLSQESFITYWDFAGFWRRAIDVNNRIQSEPQAVLQYIYRTILVDEYSSFPQLLMAIPLRLIGDTYPRFVLSNVVLFLWPSSILSFIYFNIKQKNSSKLFLILSALLILLFTGNLIPMYLGYIGSVGLPFIIALFILSEREFQFKYDLTIALNLVLLVFIRRWFAYFALAYFLIFPLIRVIYHQKDWKKILIHYFIQGISALLILVIFFYPLVDKMLFYDYAYAYQYNQSSSLKAIIDWFIQFYSPIGVLFIALGMINVIKNFKKYETLVALLFQSIFILFFFNRIQLFGSHHYYMINTNILLIMLMGISLLIQIHHKFLKIGISVLCIFIFSQNFMTTFIPFSIVPPVYYQYTNQFLTNLRVLPRVNTDADNIRRIVNFINELTGENVYDYTYVLASSARFSDELLRNAYLPEQLNPIPSLYSTKQIDERDGLPYYFFTFKYIVVTDPIQLVNPAHQNVISILANGMLNDDELRKYYFLEKEFELNSGIKVYVYGRMDTIPEEIVNRYESYFKEIFPDNPNMYDFK